MKQIIHDWGDEECIRILTKCRQAMKPGGRVLVVDEMVTPGKKIPQLPALIDVQLHLLVKGRKCSEAEHHPLFEAAGLRMTRFISNTSTYSMIEAVAL